MNTVYTGNQFVCLLVWLCLYTHAIEKVYSALYKINSYGILYVSFFQLHCDRIDASVHIDAGSHWGMFQASK